MAELTPAKELAAKLYLELAHVRTEHAAQVEALLRQNRRLRAVGLVLSALTTVFGTLLAVGALT
jgi:hypothetical protein